MFNILIVDFVREFELTDAVVHDGGLDVEIGPLSLHIRQHEGLLTAFIPLENVASCALADFLDWPVLNLSSLEHDNDAILWAREWVDHLDGTALATMVERLLTQASALSERLHT